MFNADRQLTVTLRRLASCCVALRRVMSRQALNRPTKVSTIVLYIYMHSIFGAFGPVWRANSRPEFDTVYVAFANTTDGTGNMIYSGSSRGAGLNTLRIWISPSLVSDL
jgi:hypothetical protein